MGARQATGRRSDPVPQWNETLVLPFRPPLVERPTLDTPPPPASTAGSDRGAATDEGGADGAVAAHQPRVPVLPHRPQRRFTAADFAELRDVVRLDVFDEVATAPLAVARKVENIPCESHLLVARAGGM